VVNPGTKRRAPLDESGVAGKLGARCHLETARVGSAAYLVLVGEFDLSCADRFKATLQKSIADSPEDVVIDLRSVTFVDSTGLALLIKADTLARAEHFSLHVVRSPTDIVKAVCEATGVDKLLPFCDEPPQLQG
jgi:anti-sigma B factor antagonist